ncbi:hypothetical protein lerEdw1_020705 [Lerista edwardsae]|nr:hypothetical protein lerEdw1_020705 [Lerista edwardsae]
MAGGPAPGHSPPPPCLGLTLLSQPQGPRMGLFTDAPQPEEIPSHARQEVPLGGASRGVALQGPLRARWRHPWGSPIRLLSAQGQRQPLGRPCR